MAAIAALPPVEDNKDGRGLRHLYDKLLAHTKSLESAGLDHSVFAPSIRPSVVRKLPFELQADWRRMERNAACTFANFLEFLEEAADVREFAARGASAKKPVSVKSKVPATSAGKTVSTVAQLPAPMQQQRLDSGRQRNKCLFCGGNHFAVKCQVPTDKKRGNKLIGKNDAIGVSGLIVNQQHAERHSRAESVETHIIPRSVMDRGPQLRQQRHRRVRQLLLMRQQRY